MKKLLSLILVLAIIICAIPLGTFTFTASAATSSYYTYSVSNGEATITDVDTSISGDITIPSTLGGYPVTSIGDSAFYYCKSLTSITIPDSVTSIGDSAFDDCESLTSVTIGDSVTSIGYSAFRDCRSLTSVTIPDSVTSIGKYAFYGCSRLADVYYKGSEAQANGISIGSNNENLKNAKWHYNCLLFTDDIFRFFVSNGKAIITDVDESVIGNITIPSTLGGYPVTSIGSYAFEDCKSLTSITIPDSVTSIGEYAFSGCSSLTSITIPDSVTSIGGYAFYNCSSLISVTIPDSVTSIGEYAFSGCSSLTSITIPDSVTSIGEYAFSGCSSLTSITIPDSVTSIDDHAFDSCESLTSITIPDSVISIGWCAFGDCESLTSVTIGDSVTSIGGYAFSSCRSLISITIPDSVTSIGSSAFRYCSSLTSVTIGNSVTSIGEYAFSSCRSLISITIPDSVTSIGSSAFDGCSSLESITLPFVGGSATEDQYLGYIFGGSSYSNNSIYVPSSLKTVIISDKCTSIGKYAFYYCSSLTSVTIPDSVTSIGVEAFSYCSSLESITLPFVGGSADSNRYLGYIFGSSSYSYNSSYVPRSLKTVIISDKCTSIGDRAFYNCSSLTSINIPNSVTSIGTSTFSGCSSLTSINIPDSVTSIGYYAFDGCSSLTSITIPDSVTSISGSAFRSCSSLTSVTIPDSVTSIGENAFYNTAYYNDENNWKNKVLYIGNHLIEAKVDISGAYSIKEGTLIIADDAFYCCKSLKSVTIPDSVTSIGGSAFSHCTGLTSVTIGNGVTSIGENAFYNTAYYNDENNWENKVLYISKHLIDAKSDIRGEYTIKTGTLTIGHEAFRGCTSLRNITIPDSVTSIGEIAFYDCTGLTTVNFNATNCTTMGSRYSPVFDGCSNLKTVNIGDNVKIIPDYAFKNCGYLISITIPDSVTSIGVEAFYDCYCLKDVWYTGTESMKEKIVIGGYNNYLTYATWHYEFCPNAEQKVHAFDNNCDATCNICNFMREITHKYDAVCDAECNECGTERSVTHTYSGVCDKVCNVCQSIREAPDHIYDDKYDADCNECGEVRDVPNRDWQVSVNTTGVYSITPSKALSGFNKDSITVLDKNGKTVKYNNTKNGWPLVAGQNYTLKLNTEFENINDLSWILTKIPAIIFPDTDANAWYSDAVTYAVGAGIMSGYSNGKFGTSDSIQRQDFLVMLARLDGADLDDYKGYSLFPDVARNSYYESAVNWGAENGIVTGYQNGKFGVGDKVTREQLVTFLYRYAKYKGYDSGYSSNRENVVASQYKDYSRVSSFAKDPILWAIEKGVISGKTTTTIVPQGNAQRCEVAKIMYNIYLNDIFK